MQHCRTLICQHVSIQVVLALCCPAASCPVLSCAVVQSDDPGRDFRGAGLYGLDNLVYLGTHQPALFKQLMLKTQVTGTGWEGSPDTKVASSWTDCLS